MKFFIIFIFVFTLQACGEVEYGEYERDCRSFRTFEEHMDKDSYTWAKDSLNKNRIIVNEDCDLEIEVNEEDNN